MIKELAEFILKLSNNPQANERFNICIHCPKFDLTTDKCRVCGCLMTVKTFIPIARCPENKW